MVHWKSTINCISKVPVYYDSNAFIFGMDDRGKTVPWSQLPVSLHVIKRTDNINISTTNG